MTDRRAAAAERIEALQVCSSVMSRVDDDRLTGWLPGEARAPLTHDRFRERLTRRVIGQCGLTSRESAELGTCPVFAEMPVSAEAISAIAGSAWHGRELLMLLDGAAIAVFERELGFDPRLAALRAERSGIALPALEPRDAAISPEQLLADGASCWAAWLTSRPTPIGKAFAMLTPRVLRLRFDRSKIDQIGERSQIASWAITDWRTTVGADHG